MLSGGREVGSDAIAGGPVEISRKTVRCFSLAVGRLYAATDAHALRLAIEHAIDHLCPASQARDRWRRLIDGAANTGIEPVPMICVLLATHAAQCQARLEAHGRKASAGREAAFPADSILTARERQVLSRVALGETDAEVGAQLGIARKTVAKHIEHILEKLGAENRTAAVQAFRRC